MLHLHTKLEMSIFTCSRDRKGCGILKSGSYDPDHPPLNGQFIFLWLVLAMVHTFTNSDVSS